MKRTALVIHQVILVFSIFSTTTFANSLSERLDWLKETSLVGGTECRPAPVLYRGTDSGFFPMTRVLRNMLGDETAEQPSRRFSAILKEREDSAAAHAFEEAHHQASDELIRLREINKAVPCAPASLFAEQTMLGSGLAHQMVSLGIAASPLRGDAEIYVGTTDEAKDGILLEINEKIARAGLALNNPSGPDLPEYYIPVLIPAEDLRAAWGEDLYLVKTEDQKGNFKSVKIFSIVNGTQLLRHHKDVSPSFIASVVPCDEQDVCRSKLSPATAGRLSELEATVVKLRAQGLRFKIISLQN